MKTNPLNAAVLRRFRDCVLIEQNGTRKLLKNFKVTRTELDCY